MAIIGVARTEMELNAAGTNLLRHRATVELRVFRGYDGKMSDELKASAAVLAVDPMEGGAQAVRDAAAKVVGDVVVAAVMTVLGANAGGTVLLTVEDAGTESRIDLLAGGIAVLPGTNGAEVLFFSPDLSRLRVEYEGPMGPFVDAIPAAPYEGRKLEVQRAVGRNVSLRFQ